MAKIIAVVNQKGGVGKTTSAVNLTAALAATGARVLLCDFDPQANATSGLGVEKRQVTNGAYELMATLRAIKRRLSPKLEIFGVLLTMYDGRTNFSNQVAQEVRRHFPGKVFASVIPRNVRLAEAPSHGLPVIAYDKSSRGAAAYLGVAEEILRREGALTR